MLPVVGSNGAIFRSSPMNPVRTATARRLGGKKSPAVAQIGACGRCSRRPRAIYSEKKGPGAITAHGPDNLKDCLLVYLNTKAEPGATFNLPLKEATQALPLATPRLGPGQCCRRSLCQQSCTRFCRPGKGSHRS